MDQVESVFVDAVPMDENWALGDGETNKKLKIGEIFQLEDNTLALTCIRCFQEFQYYTEFSLHIQDHFLRGDIAHLKEIKQEPPELVMDEIAPESQIKVENFQYADDEPKQPEDSFDDWNDDSFVGTETGEETMNLQDSRMTEPPAEKQFQFVEGKDYIKADKKHQCLMCNRIIGRWDHLKEHLLTHIAPKNVFCPICAKAFITVAYVRKHIAQFHKLKYTGAQIREAQSCIDVEAKPIETIEMKPVPMEQKVKAFPQEHRSCACLQCGKFFSIPRYVQKHMRTVHGLHISIQTIVEKQTKSENDNGDVAIETLQSVAAEPRETPKNYECFDCHKKFATINSVRKHIHLHSGIRYSCPECGKLFAQRTYVMDHLSVVHGIKRDQSIRSKISEIVDHYDFHSKARDITSFECYLCKSTFRNRVRLRYHMKNHLMGPFLCIFCGSIFKSHDTLRHHMERHRADDARVKCFQCDKQFQTRRYMLRHFRKSHFNVKRSEPNERKLVDCTQCDKQFNCERR